MDNDNPWDNIRKIHRMWSEFYTWVGWSGLFLLIAFLGSRFFLSEVGGYWMNILTEGLGILFTITVIERLNRLRSEKERKEELIIQMGSPDNSFAVEAVRILKLKKYLFDGSLRKKNFSGTRTGDAILDATETRLDKTFLASEELTGANLKGADLGKGAFEGANFSFCNLTDANLRWASLENVAFQGSVLKRSRLDFANLTGAHLTEVNLIGSNLHGTIMRDAKLQAANLSHSVLSDIDLSKLNLSRVNFLASKITNCKMRNAKLRGSNLSDSELKNVDLTEADLSGASLANAHIDSSVKFSDKTILPDGSKYTTHEELQRFIDPDHPKFWSPDRNVTRH